MCQEPRQSAAGKRRTKLTGGGKVKSRGQIGLAKSAAQARRGNIFVCYPKPLGLATVTGQGQGQGGGEGSEQATCSFATSC